MLEYFTWTNHEYHASSRTYQIDVCNWIIQSILLPQQYVCKWIFAKYCFHIPSIKHWPCHLPESNCPLTNMLNFWSNYPTRLSQRTTSASTIVTFHCIALISNYSSRQTHSTFLALTPNFVKWFHNPLFFTGSNIWQMWFPAFILTWRKIHPWI